MLCRNVYTDVPTLTASMGEWGRGGGGGKAGKGQGQGGNWPNGGWGGHGGMVPDTESVSVKGT